MVYCKDCKYFTDISFSRGERCWNVNNCKIIEGSISYTHKEKTYTPPRIYFKEDPDNLNVTNNCRYYKRKWWKFWIKENKND